MAMPPGGNRGPMRRQILDAQLFRRLSCPPKADAGSAGTAGCREMVTRRAGASGKTPLSKGKAMDAGATSRKGKGTQAATVLLSGGLDSTVLLHHVAKTIEHAPIYALSFHYGQKHSRELEMARWQAASLAQVTEHHVVDMSFFGKLMGNASALINGGQPVPDLADLNADQRIQPPTYVPNRNMILLSLAAAFAEAHDCHELFYGAQSQDQYGYWDCTSEFVERINQVLCLNRKNAINIRAPFAEKSKAEEIRLGMALGVDFAHTWSCYRGGSRPCGTCPTCIERQCAFAESGVSDPL